MRTSRIEILKTIIKRRLFVVGSSLSTSSTTTHCETRSSTAGLSIHFPQGYHHNGTMMAYFSSYDVSSSYSARDDNTVEEENRANPLNYDDDDDDDDEDLQYSQHADDEDTYDDDGNYDNFRASNTKRNQTTQTTDDDDDEHQYETKRIWLDPQAPLKERVGRFMNRQLGTIHHLDIKLASIDLLRECGKLKSFEGMKYAHDILDRLIEEKHYVNQSRWPLMIIPDRPFQQVMYGWANLCDKVDFAPQRMREVLDSMIQESEYDKITKEKIYKEKFGKDNNSINDNDLQDHDYAGLSCEPTVAIYNTLLQGLCNASKRSIQAAVEAEQVLSAMEKMNRIHGWHCKPNTRSYSLVLNAYSKCKHKSSGDRAENVLRKMIQCHEVEKQLYMEEYDEEYSVYDLSANKRKIVTPDIIAYTSVIQAHCISEASDSADKVLGLLSELIYLDNNTNPALQLDAVIFAVAINAFAEKADKKSSAAARIEAAERAEEIWWLMVDEIKKRQSLPSGNISNDGGNQKKNNRSLQGNVVPFNAALKAWAVSYTPESPQRAQDLLFRILDHELQETIHIYPDTTSFNTCMQAWAKAAKVDKTTAPEQAEEMLNLLKEMPLNEDPTKRIHPDVQSYVTVMNAYAESRRKDSVYHVRRLLHNLLEEGRYFVDDQKITAIPFTVLLKAVAKSSDSTIEENVTEDAFGTLNDNIADDENQILSDPYSVALEVYSNVQNDTYELGVTPDHFTFAAMLDVIAAHTDKDSIERRQRIEQVFADACESGCVSSLVVKSMKNVCPNDHMLKDILKLRRHDDIVSLENINIFSKHWIQNVPPQFKRIESRSHHRRNLSRHYNNNQEQGIHKGKRHNANKKHQKKKVI